MIRIVDSHQHAWDRNLMTYPWLQGRDDLPRLALPGRDGFAQVILVESGVREDLRSAETAWLLGLCVRFPQILGVVSGLDWTHPESTFPSESLSNPMLVGVRVNLLGPAGTSATPKKLARSLRLARAGDLSIDILCRDDQLELIARALDHEPGGRVVIDHLGAPPWRHPDDRARRERWKKAIQTVSSHDEVRMKVSGMPIAPAGIEAHFWPYLDDAVELFGVDRLMLGSDWPVSSYQASGQRGAKWFARVAEHLGLQFDVSIASTSAMDSYLPPTRGPEGKR